MRISTGGAFRQNLNMLLQLQQALDRTQRQVTTGRRHLSPADDPLAAARALNMRESLSRLDQFERNATMARNRLSYEESALQSVNDILQRVRVLALQANNAGQSNESRHAISVEMRQHVDALVQLANTKDGNGRYLFAGNVDGTTPVTRSGDSFTYNGDQGRREIQIGENRRISDGNPGSEIFFRVREGNGSFAVLAAGGNTGSGIAGSGSIVDPALFTGGDYTVHFLDPASYEVRDGGGAVVATGAFASGDAIAFDGVEFEIDGMPAAGDEFAVRASRHLDVFSIVHTLAEAVDTPIQDDAGRAAMTNGVHAALLGLDQAIGRVLDVRTEVGSRLAALEAQEDSNGAFALGLEETLAGIEDLDYAEALSRLSMQVTMLEAAQQSFVRTRGLSLFNYL